jgi:transposase
MAKSIVAASIAARRREVVEGVAAGIPIDAIAERLGVSVTTARKDWKVWCAEQERLAKWRESVGETT